MFGLLDLGSCGLSGSRRRFYMCGVCNALACGYGRFTRLLLSGDDAFLSLLIAAQRRKALFDDSAPVGRCRFWSKKALRAPEFEFPAAVCMYFFGGRLIDDIHDNGSLRSRVLFALYRSKIREAEKKLREFGLNVLPAEIIMAKQHQLETERAQEYDSYSHMVEELCSAVYSHAATLAGAPDNSKYLGEVGRHIGRVTYLVDGYVDSESDKAEGKFNAFNAASRGDSRGVLAGRLAESLAVIRRSMSRVKLRRFEEAVRFVVTDGLLGRVERFVAEAKVFGGKSVLYSAVPIVLPIILSSFLSGSSGGDCDACCPDCCSSSSSRPSTSVGSSYSVGNRAATATVEAAGGTVAGFAGAEAVNRLRGGGEEEPPAEEETPVEDQPTEEIPVEEPPVPEEPPSTAPTDDQIKQTVDWGIKHNRSPDDIKKDVNQWAGRDVKVPDDMTPVTVPTKNGPATATPSEKAEYEAAKKEVDRVNQQSEWVKKEMRKIERAVTFWSLAETGPLWSRAWLGAFQHFGPSSPSDILQDKLNQIDEKYGAPRHPSWRDFEWDKHPKPDTPGYDTETVPEYHKWAQKADSDYQEALRRWEQTPEARGEASAAHSQEISQAHTDYVNEVRQMAGQQPGPGREKSWWTKPLVKLDKLNAKQDGFIKYLQNLQGDKRGALDTMRKLEERARQGGS